MSRSFEAESLVNRESFYSPVRGGTVKAREASKGVNLGSPSSPSETPSIHLRSLVFLVQSLERLLGSTGAVVSRFSAGYALHRRLDRRRISPRPVGTTSSLRFPPSPLPSPPFSHRAPLLPHFTPISPPFAPTPPHPHPHPLVASPLFADSLCHTPVPHSQLTYQLTYQLH